MNYVQLEEISPTASAYQVFKDKSLHFDIRSYTVYPHNMFIFSSSDGHFFLLNAFFNVFVLKEGGSLHLLLLKGEKQ